MIFPRRLSDRKSLQVSRTLLSTLADSNNTVVWMISIRPLISKSSSPFTKPLWIVSSALITVGITVTFIFHTFFSSLARSSYLRFFFLVLLFSLCFAETASLLFGRFSHLFIFLLTITRSGRIGRD